MAAIMPMAEAGEVAEVAVDTVAVRVVATAVGETPAAAVTVVTVVVAMVALTTGTAVGTATGTAPAPVAITPPLWQASSQPAVATPTLLRMLVILAMVSKAPSLTSEPATRR